MKNHVSCNFMLKYYITVSLRHFTKTSNQFFYLSSANENSEICMRVWFVQLNESNQIWGNFIGCFNKWRLSQKYKIAFSLKTAACEDMIFIWLVPAMKQLLEQIDLEFLHALNFCCARNNFAYMPIHLLFH